MVAILLVIGFIYWSAGNDPEATPDGDPKLTDNGEIPMLSAEIIYSTGEVKIRSAEDSWRDAKNGDQLKYGHYLQTGDDSRAILQLPDDSILRLSSNAEIKISELSMADIAIEQKAGHVFHRVNGDSTAIYQVINGNTELTALGTAFNVLTSSELTYLTVTESKVKVKIYDGENITNMRTITSGEKATINPTLPQDQTIAVKETDSEELLEDEWFTWNLEKDREKEYYLGIFEVAVELTLLEPKLDEDDPLTVDEDHVLIKGETDPEAQIFISGKELDNNNGEFQIDYLLSGGDNEIEIVVKVGKNQNRKTFIVKSTKEQTVLTLNGEVTEDNVVELNWETENLPDNFSGFKVVRSNAEDPTYPDAPYHSIAQNLTQDEWEDLDNGNHFFRVCMFTAENKCLNYSNNLELEITGNEPEPDGTINLTYDKLADETVNLNWSLSKDLNAVDGFKALISQHENPEYPGSSYHSISGNQRSDTWKKLTPGDYHFRICLLRDTECVLYSNDIAVTVEETVEKSLLLSGGSHFGKINLFWSPTNLDEANGWQVIMSQTAGVSYPGDDSRIINDFATQEFSWEGLEENTNYYFKVCENTTAGVCSNELAVKLLPSATTQDETDE